MNVSLAREPADTTGSPPPGRQATSTFGYSRVKFVVHYFLGGSLSESNLSLLNSAGTAARIARVRARRVLVKGDAQLSSCTSVTLTGNMHGCKWKHIQTA